MEQIQESVTRSADADHDAAYRRGQAVAAALIVIANKASGADSTNLRSEMGNLSTYADQIQAALETK